MLKFAIDDVGPYLELRMAVSAKALAGRDSIFVDDT